MKNSRSKKINQKPLPWKLTGKEQKSYFADRLIEFGVTIKELDQRMLGIALKRFLLCIAIGKMKALANIPIHRPKIEETRIRNARKYGKKVGLPPYYAEDLIRVSIKHCKGIQKSGQARKTRKKAAGKK